MKSFLLRQKVGISTKIKTLQKVHFHRNRTNNPKIYIEPQKTPNSQSNLEKE